MKIGRTAVNLLAFFLVKGNKKRRKSFSPLLKDFEGKVDVPYIDDGDINHQFDIFYAKNENRKNVCIIDIHGGSYIFGEHRDNFIFGYQFLKQGYDFVAVDYVPNDGKKETKDSIDDCVLCIKYIFSHLEELKLDNDRFIMMGDSAGGHFALLLALASSNKNIADKLGYDFEGIDFEMTLVNCPVYDFVNIGRNLLNKRGLKRLFGPNYHLVENLKIISPRTYIKNFNMPLFVSTCTKDFLRNESLLLNEDAKKYSLNIEFVDYQSNKRGVEHVHNVVRPSLPESKDVNELMFKFIEKHL